MAAVQNALYDCSVNTNILVKKIPSNCRDQAPREEREEVSGGSLTSVAEQVLFAHIEMQVFDTQSAVLEMHLLLITVAGII